MNKMQSIAVAAAFALGTLATGAAAHDAKYPHSHNDQLVSNQVTPDSEKLDAAELEATGPTETTGIKSVKMLGKVPLAGEISSFEDRMIRTRELELEPGGVVAVHRHDERPGVAYIISGEVTEHRSGAAGPVVKRAGDVALEQNGTVHWWENEGDTVAKVVVVDIVPVE